MALAPVPNCSGSITVEMVQLSPRPAILVGRHGVPTVVSCALQPAVRGLDPALSRISD